MWVHIRGNMVNLKSIFLIRLTLNLNSYSGKSKDITIIDTHRIDEIFEKNPTSQLKIWINGVELANYSLKDLKTFHQDWDKIMLAVKLYDLSDE